MTHARSDSPSPAPRRARARLTAVALLALGAAGAWGAGTWATGWIEDRTGAAVRAELARGRFDWATASADGLRLRLSGTAPDENAHVRALAAASAHVATARIEDAIVVPKPAEATPPAFRLEILQSDQRVSVIGLVPDTLDRSALLARVAKNADGTIPADLLETASYPAPKGWDAAADFGITAAGLAPRAKVTIAPGRVEVAALTNGAAEKTRLEETLRAATPDGVTLVTDISAPRPVISPFVLTATRTVDGLRLAPCAADTDAARALILSAAKAAGAKAGDCAIGLGAPSPQWGEAAVAAIKALADLPAGTVTLHETQVTLSAPATVPQTDFETVRDMLIKTLPRIFTVTATQEKPAPVVPDGPPSFIATAGDTGIQLRGSISDERMGAVMESISRARFGNVDSALIVNPKAPDGWSLRLIGALEAMGDLRRGSATVTPYLIRLTGSTGDRDAAKSIAGLLGKRLGAGVPYELALSYDPRLDPALNLPTGEECVARLNDTMAQAEIGFEPNRSVIAGDPADTLGRLGRTMSECGDFRIEIGGHTDSQGSDQFNMELSEGRAKAVLAAMQSAGIDTDLIVAKGYGETRPVADNDTDEGREANRRIEFRLLSPYPVAETVQPATVQRGVTKTAPAATENPPLTAGSGTGTDTSRASAKGSNPAADPALASERPSVPMPDRLPGVPPALAGSENAMASTGTDPAQNPASATSEAVPDGRSVSDPATDQSDRDQNPDNAAPGAQPTAMTPDDRAAAQGIKLRPETITINGARVSTPVPPPFGAGTAPEAPGPQDADSKRPPARPE